MGESPSLHACLGEAARSDRHGAAVVAVIEALSRAAGDLAQIIGDALTR